MVQRTYVVTHNPEIQFPLRKPVSAETRRTDSPPRTYGNSAAGETVEPDDDQGLAGLDLVQQARQHRPAAVCARGVLLKHHGAAGRAQLVECGSVPCSSVETRA